MSGDPDSEQKRSQAEAKRSKSANPRSIGQDSEPVRKSRAARERNTCVTHGTVNTSHLLSSRSLSSVDKYFVSLYGGVWGQLKQSRCKSLLMLILLSERDAAETEPSDRA